MIDLYNGDCLDIMDSLIKHGIKVDAIITDPPYGTTACKWDTIIPFVSMWERLNKMIKPNGAIVLFGSEPFSSKLRMSNIDNYKYDWIWVKNNCTNLVNAKKMPLRSYESISVFYNQQPTYNPIKIKRTENELKRISRNSQIGTKDFDNNIYGKVVGANLQKRENYEYKNADNVLHFNSVHSRDKRKVPHPTQKPVELMEYLIKTYTNENEVVLDFTMGSGSTGVACKNTNRRFIGIEKDEKYFQIAKDRINSLSKSEKLFC